jgi:hypothetical protein
MTRQVLHDLNNNVNHFYLSLSDLLIQKNYKKYTRQNFGHHYFQ